MREGSASQKSTPPPSPPNAGSRKNRAGAGGPQKAIPAVISGLPTLGGEDGEQPGHLMIKMRGSPFGSKRRSSGTGTGLGQRGEEDTEHSDARASIDLPPLGEDWERQVCKRVLASLLPRPALSPLRPAL
eukprot:scaffold100978_cov17-Tisochrysis_lutea.AAC.1